MKLPSESKEKHMQLCYGRLKDLKLLETRVAVSGIYISPNSPNTKFRIAKREN